MAKHKVVIAGAGGMGRAVGLLLRELGDWDIDLAIGDVQESQAHDAASWIGDGSKKSGAIEPFFLPAEGTSEAFEAVLSDADILLDCLPGSEAPRMAAGARRFGLHYANLTEYVAETRAVIDIAQGAETGFIVQTGLAPGFVNVLGHGLFQQFCQEHGVDRVERLEMRVGALTPHVRAPFFYGYTWSPIGVATEYVKPAIVVRDYVEREIPSLSERATILVGEKFYEEDLTSGGAADLPTALAGRVRNLDYKTLRHPGHYAWVESVLAACPQGTDPVDYLNDRMLAEIPHVDGDDLVVVIAAVEGNNSRGHLHRRERAYLVRPQQIGARRLKAIQTTTTSALAESARILLDPNGPRGVCFQSQIDLESFLAGPFVGQVYCGAEV